MVDTTLFTFISIEQVLKISEWDWQILGLSISEFRK